MQFFSDEETITINGKTVKKIYGGFGDGQPAILAKQVAELHGYDVGHINEIIVNNLDWFDEGIDIIDLKPAIVTNDSEIKSFLLNFYTQKALNASRYVFILSQQGYALLIKFLKSDLAKQTYKLMVREYFGLKFATNDSFAKHRYNDLVNWKYNALNHISEDDLALELMLRKRTKMLETFGVDKSKAVFQAAESIRQDTGIDVIKRLNIRTDSGCPNSDTPEYTDRKDTSSSSVSDTKLDTKPATKIPKQMRPKDTKSVSKSQVPKFYRGWNLNRRGRNKNGEELFNLSRKIGNKRVQKYLGIWNQEKADHIIEEMNQKYNEKN